MRAVRMVFWAQLRHRWRSWLAIAILISLVGGVVMAAVAAGQRTDSAFPASWPPTASTQRCTPPSPHPRSPGSPKSARRRWPSAPTTVSPSARVRTRSTRRTSVWWSCPPREDRSSISCRAACRILRTRMKWWPRTRSNRTRGYAWEPSSVSPSTPPRSFRRITAPLAPRPNPRARLSPCGWWGSEPPSSIFLRAPLPSTTSTPLKVSSALCSRRWRPAMCTSSASVTAQLTFPDLTPPPGPSGGRSSHRMRTVKSHQSKRRFTPRPSDGGYWRLWPHW